jgi:hypothetical protein
MCREGASQRQSQCPSQPSNGFLRVTFGGPSSDARAAAIFQLVENVRVAITRLVEDS